MRQSRFFALRNEALELLTFRLFRFWSRTASIRKTGLITVSMSPSSITEYSLFVR